MPTWRTARSATCSCRPRSCTSSRRSSARGARAHPGRRSPWMFHLLAAPGATAGDPSYETDRARFIGRGRTAANPQVLDGNRPAALSNTAGSVLDPIVAIRRTLGLSARRDRHRADHLGCRGLARGGPRPARQVLRPALRRTRLRNGVVPEPGGAASPQRQRSRCAGLRAPGRLRHLRQCAAPRRARHHCPQPEDAVGAVALRDLGRSADRAAAHRRHQPHRHAQAGAAGPCLLAHEGAGGRPGDRERGFLRLPGGAAGPDHGTDQRGARSAGARQAGRGLRAARRRAFRGRAGPAADRRPHRVQRHRRGRARAGRAPGAGGAQVGPAGARARRQPPSRYIRSRRASASSATAWAVSRPTDTSTSSPSSPARARRRRGST